MTVMSSLLEEEAAEAGAMGREPVKIVLFRINSTLLAGTRRSTTRN
jgi:hypothetical protein